MYLSSNTQRHNLLSLIQSKGMLGIIPNLVN